MSVEGAAVGKQARQAAGHHKQQVASCRVVASAHGSQQPGEGLATVDRIRQQTLVGFLIG